MTEAALKEFLDLKADHYEHPRFIAEDPIQIPHRFSTKEDIEISGFLAATIAWGNRKTIIRNALRITELMDEAPYEFVMQFRESDLSRFEGFVHRTFNATDLKFFLRSLRHIYEDHHGLEGVFTQTAQHGHVQAAISEFRKCFFSLPHPDRTRKHVSDPGRGSSAKRINMFLRWMVRSPEKGVDFGLWQNIPTSALSCPLDVHTGNVARSLGLLQRKQNDAKALQELDSNLRALDAKDPVKYDFALFGLGVFEKWGKEGIDAPR